MVRGPKDYIPAVEADVVLRRKAIPLDVNEGIYVRDVKTGKIRSVIGSTYLLTENEELWEKELPAQVEQLIVLDPRYFEDKLGSSTTAPPRDKSKVITYRVPHNACVQIYDYKSKKARIVFGPELVMLGPDEQFTVLNLSGEKPKVPNKIRAICLLLGPEFSSDIVTIESSDHARLSLRLSYNWHFEVRSSLIRRKISCFFFIKRLMIVMILKKLQNFFLFLILLEIFAKLLLQKFVEQLRRFHLMIFIKIQLNLSVHQYLVSMKTNELTNDYYSRKII